MRNVDLQSPVHVTADWLSAERSQTGFAKDPVPVKLECALAALGLLTHAPPLIIYDPPGHLNRNFKNATVLFYLHLLRHCTEFKNSRLCDAKQQDGVENRMQHRS